jgi:hypothetical protein
LPMSRTIGACGASRIAVSFLCCIDRFLRSIDGSSEGKGRKLGLHERRPPTA